MSFPSFLTRQKRARVRNEKRISFPVSFRFVSPKSPIAAALSPLFAGKGVQRVRPKKDGPAELRIRTVRTP